MRKILVNILYTILLIIAWTVIVVVATVRGKLHTPIASSHDSRAFIEATDGEIDKQFTGSFAMAVFDDGVVDYEKFHTEGNPVDRNTVFQVSSLSKWISAFGIMKLVEDGRIDLDAPVSKYLTRWHLPKGKFNNEGVTVRRLLSHTAGLTDHLGYSGFEPGTPVQSLEESLTKAEDADESVDGSVHVGVEPGSEFIYSGGGYTILQLIVEEVSGQSFDSYMKESVFVPLGMIHSSYTWDESAPYTLVEFYNSDGTRSKHYRYTSLAATSLYTSLSDLEIFFQAHLEGRNGEPVGRKVLHPETLKMMRKSHAQKMGIDIWGLGTVLYVINDDYDFVIGHDGKSTPAINTAVRLDPKTGDGIIVLETGNPMIATKLASEWMFWKTGKVDTFLFPMLVNGMKLTIIIGWIVIILGMIVYFFMKPR